MTKLVGEKLTHAAYRSSRCGGVDEVDGAFGLRVVKLQVI
jgi:hypothetical protein